MIKRSPEKMHRISENRNDWDTIPSSKLNPWQRVAKRTKGFVTLGNVITVAGGVFTLDGIVDIAQGHNLSGVIKIGIGRMADIADGEAAQITGTKGVIGSQIDPLVDTIALGAALPVLAVAEVLPVAAAVVIGIPKATNAASTIAAKLRKRPIQVEGEGKTGTFTLWLGIGAFAVRAALPNLHAAIDTGLQMAGWLGAVGGSIMQLPATAKYISAGLGRNSN